MITKISKIKKLGLFNSYSWDGDLEKFKRYNLIYGLNGTGKTTLSNLVSVFGTADTSVLNDCEYEFETEDEGVFSNNKPYATKIRVFNKKFIESNVKIVEGKAEPIVILGDDSREIYDRIRTNEVVLNGDPNDPSDIGFIRKLQETEDSIKKTEDSRSSAFTAIARTIGSTFGGDAVRSYTKKNSEPDFRDLSGKESLSQQDFEKYTKITNQQLKEEVPEIPSPSLTYEEKVYNTFDFLNPVLEESKSLMKRTVESSTIERLRDNSDISEWVETGLAIHKTHNSKRCEFCEQILPEERVKKLGDHFNEEDKKLKEDIDSALAKLRLVYRSIESTKVPDKARLYDYFQDKYEIMSDDFDVSRIALLKSLEEVAEELKNKKTKTWDELELNTDVSQTDAEEVLSVINSRLQKHNTDVKNLDKKKDDAKEKIKKHHLSSIYDEVKSFDKEVQELESKKKILLDGDTDNKLVLGINQIRKQITKDRDSISSAHNGCSKVNEMLLKLLGREEIVFEPKEEEDGKVSGYLIKRGEEVAKNISDGEQAAIAFAYFCIHLSDQDFKLKDGIIVLDDPVSSLDYGMLYRVCAHIESKLSGAGQLFILTHNYDFFNQMKNWFKNSPQINNIKEGEGEPNGRLMMLKSVYCKDSQSRTSEIAELDELLRDYESEYHYLFKKLSQFDVDNPPEDGVTLKAIYDYPNMTRKLLECFLAFRCPKNGSMFVRLKNLKKINKDIADEDISYVYDFINSHSHLDTKNGLIQFNPTLSLSGRDSVIKALELVQLADEKHYKAMQKATSVTS